MILDQINDMKHCIGYEQRHVKRGKYKAYRNYYNTGEERCKNWDELVVLEYANYWTKHNQHFYYLTEKGIKFLSEILDVKITEIK